MFSLSVDDSLSLELLERKHAQPLYSVIQDQRDFLSQWLDWVQHTRARSDVEAFIARSREDWARYSSISCAICVAGDPVGTVSLDDIDSGNHSASLGYWLSPLFQGKGVVHRSAHALLEAAMGSALIHRANARCAVGNEASRQVIERLNFTFEATLRSSEYVNGSYNDQYLYSLLSSD